MIKKIITTILLSATLCSCVEGLNTDQKRKLVAIKNQAPENYVEEKNEGAALALGLLPGGGSFYTRHYVVGVVDLLLWPVSILWDPINGINGAEEINYYSSLQSIKRTKKRELDALEEKFIKKSITQEQYLLETKKNEKKHDIDYFM